MTIDIFVLKGFLNGENRSVAFLFLSGIYLFIRKRIVLIDFKAATLIFISWRGSAISSAQVLFIMWFKVNKPFWPRKRACTCANPGFFPGGSRPDGQKTVWTTFFVCLF